MCSGGPSADDIHDVTIVPAAAAVSDFNSVPAVVSLGYWIGLRKAVGCSPLLCSREPFLFSQKIDIKITVS